MKRILLLTIAVLAAATSCSKKVSSEQLIEGLVQHFDTKGDQFSEPLAGKSAENRADFITYHLGKTLGAADIWTLDVGSSDEENGQVIVAEFKSHDKNADISVLSASLDDPEACGAVLAVLDAFKQAKIRPAMALRAVFYDGGETGTEGIRTLYDDFNQSGEIAAFDIEVSSLDSIPEKTFLIEDRPVFVRKIIEVIPAYLTPVCQASVKAGDFPREGWPVLTPTYRYRLGDDRIDDLKALSVFTLLMN